MSSDADDVSDRWTQWRSTNDLEEYHSRWRRLESTGRSPHGEADFIELLHPSSVLDAGCGMGRVAIELARRGIEVVGVDLDDDLLAFARRSEPSLPWVHADLSTVRLQRTFDVVAMAGNVMVFCRPSDRAGIVRRCAAHLEPAGLVVAGFQLESADDSLTLVEYDRMCIESGLELVERWSTWDRVPYGDQDYAVSVHCRA